MDRRLLLIVAILAVMASAICAGCDVSAPGDEEGSEPSEGDTDLAGRDYVATGVCDTGAGAASWRYVGTALTIGSGSVGQIDPRGSWGDWTLTGLTVDGVPVPDEMLRTYSPSDIFGTISLYLEGNVDADDGVFRSLGVRNVSVGGSATSVPSGMFANCTALGSVSIGGSVRTVGDGAFSGCTLLSRVTISDAVESIGSRAFSGCTSLRSVDVMGASVEIDTFSGCTSLASISATGSRTYTSVDGLLLSGGGRTVYICPPGISSGIIELDGGLSEVTRVYLNEADVVFVVDAKGRPDVSFVRLEGARAGSLTYSSLGMETASIRSTVTGLLLQYTTYPSWDVVEDEMVVSGLTYTSRDGSFTLVLDDGADAVFLPMGVGSMTYADLAAMTSAGDWGVSLVGIPEGDPDEVVEDVDPPTIAVTDYRGDGTDVTLPEVLHYHGLRCLVAELDFSAGGTGTIETLTVEGEVSVPDRAFEYCTGLVRLVADSVTSVGDRAFAFCTSLESASLLSCASFGDGAFASCWALELVIAGAPEVTFGDGAFDGSPSVGAILADTDSRVSGNGGVPVVHFDTGDVYPWSFRVEGRFLLVSWEHKSRLYYSHDQGAPEGSSQSTDFYRGGVAIVQISDGLYLRAVDGYGGGYSTNYYQVVFDPGLGLEPRSVNVSPDRTVSSYVPSAFGYTFQYWALDGSEYDFSQGVDRSMVLTAVWVRDDPIDATPMILLAVFAASVVAVFAIAALTRRMNR